MSLKIKSFSSTPAQPKHAQVTNEFRRLILSRDFQPGEQSDCIALFCHNDETALGAIKAL